MKNIDNFFFFGFGQTAKYFINNLVQSKKKFTFCATNTKKTSLKTLDKKKFKSYKFKDEIYDKKLINKFLILCIPSSVVKTGSFGILIF